MAKVSDVDVNNISDTGKYSTVDSAGGSVSCSQSQFGKGTIGLAHRKLCLNLCSLRSLNWTRKLNGLIVVFPPCHGCQIMA